VGMNGPERDAGFDPGAELGPRLRRVREERGLSVRELARRISCSPSLISQIERGLSAPSVGILYAIATELRASLDFLFGVAAGGDAMLATAHGDGRLRLAGAAPDGGRSGEGPGWAEGHGVVQRVGGRRTIDLASGVRWERLTPGADDRVNFLEVIYEPSGHSTDARRPLRHDGQEYGLIISGRLQASVGFETFELGPGDSIAFDSSLPHQYWNATDADVHAIWVVVHDHPGRA
jgi:transcriptional regulator with XRE-family HTH domain/mannose-6-phosphate isomerase-like protein (cupin superfamily)